MNERIDSQWIKCSQRLPRNGRIVETKIDDQNGARNIQRLKRQGRLWYFPDESMYVYYTPTHWAPLPELPPDSD